MAPYIRADLQRFEAYSSAECQHDVDAIKLSANELPWDLSQQGYHRYPQQQPDVLLQRLSAVYNTPSANCLLTRGSDEAIDLLIRLSCQPGRDSIIICPPTFGMYHVSAQLNTVGTIDVPLQPAQGFQLDVENIIRRKPQAKLLFLCSPNNPTGNLLPEDTLLHLCRAFTDHGLVVVDEAYIEFSGSDSLLKHLHATPNIVILRTLSKAFGLAGVRCGVVLAHKTLIYHLRQIMPPYPFASPVINTLLDYLSADKLHQIDQCVKTIIAQREDLAAKLKQHPSVIRVYPSAANFLCVKMQDAEAVLARCRASNILLRDVSGQAGLAGCVRITVGTAQQNAMLLDSL